ncbi:LysR family transcriptional regulator [Hydrogenophaga sp.]|uniref:LysR family transcriptional regulator n=1 Tax=Hydrogenophaga sp. TaxID=1904254 RepID=UPI001ACC1846|nr:LysR family transcriptional regulator [Hydrogenophaga sp.]MBN9372124.1 LysR family transcriptional regulator [Hydrogenophaga sp.]
MTLNYRHLHYFWVVAKEGGFARAAERLDMAVQTISAQVKELEKSLGYQLLKPQGRGFVLTEAGETAFARAEEIFRIGHALPGEVKEAASHKAVRLAVGLSDGISKLAAHALLGPVLATPNLRLVIHEGEFEQLQSELALHHLDVVLAGQAAPHNPNLRLASERLASSPVDWYGPSALVGRGATRDFPACLAQLPVLLPTGHAVLRSALDRWFDQQGLRPRIAGEFEDSALMAVFAAQGLGVFPVSRLGARDLLLLRGMRLLAQCEDVREDIYAIRSRRGLHHPLARKLAHTNEP